MYDSYPLALSFAYKVYEWNRYITRELDYGVLLGFSPNKKNVLKSVFDRRNIVSEIIQSRIYKNRKIFERQESSSANQFACERRKADW